MPELIARNSPTNSPESSKSLSALARCPHNASSRELARSRRAALRGAIRSCDRVRTRLSKAVRELETLYNVKRHRSNQSGNHFIEYDTWFAWYLLRWHGNKYQISLVFDEEQKNSDLTELLCYKSQNHWLTWQCCNVRNNENFQNTYYKLN